MSPPPDAGQALWRVGYHLDPLGFTPHALYGFNHRFDDVQRRFRTLYFAEYPETSLREVLADFRPNLAARQRHIERYGPEAAEDFPQTPITARWRIQHVLVAAMVHLDGPLIDLTDVATRREIEDRHAQLLVDYGLAHLDLHEITTGKRPVTQTIAAELFDRGAAAIRFSSRLDGNACVALFEGRGNATASAAPVALTDPPPQPLVNVTAAWDLLLEPTS